MDDLVQRLQVLAQKIGGSNNLAYQVLDRIEQLETALAKCRDAVSTPAPGERPEQSWSEAIGDPMAVPAYVKETVTRLEREKAELRNATLDLAKEVCRQVVRETNTTLTWEGCSEIQEALEREKT
jgi:hypothetical protein